MRENVEKTSRTSERSKPYNSRERESRTAITFYYSYGLEERFGVEASKKEIGSHWKTVAGVERDNLKRKLSSFPFNFLTNLLISQDASLVLSVRILLVHINLHVPEVEQYKTVVTTLFTFIHCR